MSLSVIALEAKTQKQSEHLVDLKEGLADISETLAEVTLSQVELKTSLFGIDRQNGMRGEIRSLREEVKEISHRLTDLERD